MSDSARRRTLFVLGLFAALLASRLCHLHILWAEEGYGSAGAVQILHGKMIYRDFWFDKPPIAALLYVLWGGTAGWALRIAGALFGLLTALAAWRCASALWSEREGYWAAGLVTFYLIFDIPAAVMTLGPDLIVVPLAFIAISCVLRKEPIWAGLWCAVALQSNAKALLLVAVVLFWGGRRHALKIAAAFAAGTAVGLTGLAVTGPARLLGAGLGIRKALFARYVREHPVREGGVRSLNWLGFHLALVVPAATVLMKEKGRTRLRFAIWLCLAAAGVWAGERSPALLPHSDTARNIVGGSWLRFAKWMVRENGGGTHDESTMALRFLRLSRITADSDVRFGPRYVLLAEDSC